MYSANKEELYFSNIEIVFKIA